VVDGIAHILGGIDHLLFLVLLVLPMRRLAPIVGTVTAFTVAHSITLVGASLGLAPDAPWFPPLVEVLIAASIVAMAAENILGARLERRWVLAFGFGLVHGFGFAFALREQLQFAGGHLLSALAAFNAGVELGQLGVLVVLVPAVWLAWRAGVPERGGVMLASAVVAHSAWHWMTERWAVLRAYPRVWPTMDAALGATVLQLLLLAAVAWGAGQLLAPLLRRFGAIERSARREIALE
nr:HupE/UreJ family protein [Gemmatimonadaceae bacterium]